MLVEVGYFLVFELMIFVIENFIGCFLFCIVVGLFGFVRVGGKYVKYFGIGKWEYSGGC